MNQRLQAGRGGQKIIMKDMETDPGYKDYVKNNYPDIYEEYIRMHPEEAPNNLMKAIENDGLELDTEWEGGSSGTSLYDEPNYNFNPGGL